MNLIIFKTTPKNPQLQMNNIQMCRLVWMNEWMNELANFIIVSCPNGIHPFQNYKTQQNRAKLEHSAFVRTEIWRLAGPVLPHNARWCENRVRRSPSQYTCPETGHEVGGPAGGEGRPESTAFGWTTAISAPRPVRPLKGVRVQDKNRHRSRTVVKELWANNYIITIL